MKAFGMFSALMAVIAGTAVAVKPGDSRMDVVNELGAPAGFIRFGNEETLYFDRGQVQMQNGKVVDFELISVAQLQERREAVARARAAQAALTAEQRAQLKTEGEAALQTLLADHDFAVASAAVQVARWREFMQKYPDVAVSQYYLPALKRWEEEQARAVQEQRIAALEQRVQEVEQRAMQNDASKWQYPAYYVMQPPLWYPSYFPGSSYHHGSPPGPVRSHGTAGGTSISF